MSTLLNKLPHPELGMTPEEAQAKFEELQTRLAPLWEYISCINQDEQTVVVVPSMNIDAEMNGSELQAYEERFLFLLLLLRQPRARLIYVTSQMIHPTIIEYYLDLLPGVIPSQARKRLFLISPLDASVRSLSLKLLERPKILEQIRALIIDPAKAHLVPYNTTTLERDLAIQLGIPMYGADPKFFELGTKTGCRRLFREENVVHPIGIEDLHKPAELVDAILELQKQKPDIKQVLVKLDEGVSGEGNALVVLEGASTPSAVEERLRAMQFEADYMTYELFMEKLAARGGVVEERITGDEFVSPSVQLRATPLGTLEILSTHDQLLGGLSGQTYLGCRFPGSPDYAVAITREAEKIGKRLVKEGVLGRFALDFVCARSAGESEWRPYAIEINLRKGGTTHPFLTLQFLTDGTYDPDTARFTTPDGAEKHFVATDHFASPLLRAFTADDVFDIAARHCLHFDTARQTGTVFHMLSGLGENGSIGFVAVGNSPAHAEEIYQTTCRVLSEEAQAAVGLQVEARPRAEEAKLKIGV
jgi:hypothetical protein